MGTSQRVFKTLMVGSFVFLATLVSQIESAKAAGYVQGLLGVGIYNNSGGTNLTYGVGAGYKMMPGLSFGADLTFNSISVPSPLTSNVTMILANGKYDLAPGAFIGAKLGATMISYSGTGAPASTTSFTAGPTAGYDYAFRSNLSVGGEASVLFIGSNPALTDVQALANLKFWY